MNDAASNSTPASTRRLPRVDGFTLIHKAIRFALADLMTRMARGESTFAELEDVLVFCESHVKHEDTFYRPALAERLQGPVPAFDDGHPTHERYIAELRALAKNTESASPDHRAASASALYRHYTKFVAESLAHMAEEEDLVQPLLERHFTDEELLGIHGRMMASLTIAERVRAARLMFPAIDRTERANLFGNMIAKMPPPAVAGLLDAVRPVLSAAIFAELEALAPASKAVA